MLSDEEIIDGCLQGKARFQKLLYRKFAPTMFGVCKRYFNSSDQAEDALQEGFIKVFGKLSDFRREGSLEGWIRRIMVTTSLNYHRNNRKHYFLEDVEDLHDGSEDVMFNEDTFTRDDLLKTLQGLPPGYKLVFNLFEIEGYSHKEIADMLDISVNTSKSQLSKARRVLQRKLLALYDNENPLYND